MTYEFDLELEGTWHPGPELDQVVERLYELVDDCSLSGTDGRATVTFDREADSLLEAIGSAVVDVEKATGIRVKAVESEHSKIVREMNEKLKSHELASL